MVPIFDKSITNNYSLCYRPGQDKCQYSNKKSSLEQNSPLNNQVHDIINSKLVREKRKGEEF